MRTRVVHVTGCLDMGGQEKLLVEFAKHADRDHFELRFVSLTTRGVLTREIEALGWPVDALDIADGLHVDLPWKLASMLRKWRADVVHTHNERPLIYAALAARLAGVRRVIHTKHGRGTYNTDRQKLLAAMAARLTDHFVCVSKDCAKLAAKEGVKRSRLTTLHNGIDTERFAFTGPNPRGPAVIVARLCLDKEIATLLEAVALVVRAAPEFRLHIAGDGPSRAELTQLAERLGLGEGVRFLGMVRDVPALLRDARMFVLSSISEGVPLTVLEAMACGLPVAATRVGGVPEVVADETTGLLVPPRHPAALAAALLRMQRDLPLARDFGEAGRTRVVEAFDIRRMVERYERMYLGLADAPDGHAEHSGREKVKCPSPAQPANHQPVAACKK